MIKRLGHSGAGERQNVSRWAGCWLDGCRKGQCRAQKASSHIRNKAYSSVLTRLSLKCKSCSENGFIWGGLLRISPLLPRHMLQVQTLMALRNREGSIIRRISMIPDIPGEHPATPGSLVAGAVVQEETISSYVLVKAMKPPFSSGFDLFSLPVAVGSQRGEDSLWEKQEEREWK